MVTHRATLDVPRKVVLFLSRLLAAECALRGTRKESRALTCFQRAVMALRYFRDGTDPATLARDHGIGRSIVYRYIDEAIAVLAGQALALHQALHQTVPIFVSDVEPGSVNDLPATCTYVLGALYALAAKGLPTLADAGYQGASIRIITPIKQPSHGPPLALDNRTLNKLQRGVRALGERGFALLTQRCRLLQHITSPRMIGDIARAALTLTHFKYGRLT